MLKKKINYILLGTLFILLMIAVMNQISDEVNWKVGDFIVMGLLLFSAGLSYEFVAKKMRTTAYRVAVAIVIVILFLLIWAELAVGLFGTPLAGS